MFDSRPIEVAGEQQPQIIRLPSNGIGFFSISMRGSVWVPSGTSSAQHSGDRIEQVVKECSFGHNRFAAQLIDRSRGIAIGADQLNRRFQQFVMGDHGGGSERLIRDH